jgi:RNA recognition motif-containing protein
MYTMMPQMTDEEEPYDGLLKLFIGGLNYLSLQSDIKSYFETFGKVANCTLLVDKGSGKSRGFAFVSIEDPSKLYLHSRRVEG